MAFKLCAYHTHYSPLGCRFPFLITGSLAPRGFSFGGQDLQKTAVLVDGGFFTKRFPRIFPKLDKHDPKMVADKAHELALAHLHSPKNKQRTSDLYRIYFYDCPPLSKRIHLPISGNALNLATTPQAIFRNALHQELRQIRKVALRFGRLDEENAQWQLHGRALKQLLKNQKTWDELSDSDFHYYARQKVVDTKIGLDIALLAEKRLVDQIVLIAGDSDFVPAAKHARREGIDFVLDPMWNHIAPDLTEHIDGLRSTCPKPA